VALAQAHEALAHIGAGRNVHAQAVGRVLVHEAPVGARQQALLCLAHGQHVLQRAAAVLEVHAARIGPAACGHGVEQGGLARAGLADHGQHLAGPQVERGILQRDALAIALADAAHAEQGGGG
jgi:hypothetical protein